MPEIQIIESLEDYRKAIQDAGSKLVAIDFHATWCGPCKMIAPTVKELADKHPNVVFLKVDVDEAEDVAKEEEISAMPTFLFYKAGQKLEDQVLVGGSKDKLIERVEALDK